MKKQINASVIGGLSRIAKVGQGFDMSRRTELIYDERMYSLEYVLNQNERSNLNGLVIDIDAEKTAKVDNDLFDVETIKEQLKKVTRNQKRAIKFSTEESYISALEDDADVPYVPFLEWLEYTVIAFEQLKAEEPDELSQLKAQAKELGIVLKGKQTVESIKKKIEEAE